MTVPDSLSRHLPAIEAALKDAVGYAPAEISAACRYVMGWEDADGTERLTGGKRIRPALCLFAAETLGGAIADAMPAAVALELVHNFSLVHDEVQDRDLERHHRPTIWARFGEGQAINVGDQLYASAIRALITGTGQAQRRLRALALLTDAVSRMIDGQWSDLAFEARTDVTVDDYLAMVAGKTGALLSAPIAMGAVMAGLDDETAAKIGTWGLEVGLAFQIHDDYLGIWGDTAKTGKSNTSDIRRKKKTLPIIAALANEDAAAVITAAYAKRELGDTDVQRVIEALERAGADETTRAHAEHHITTAAGLLSELPLETAQRAQFAEIADYLINRQA